MNDRLAATLRLLPDYLAQHVILSLLAIVLGIAIAAPLAMACLRWRNLRWPLLTLTSIVQTVPGLALMALFYPALLALSAFVKPLTGWEISALGFTPALLALTLYAILPVLRNAIIGIDGVDADVVQAAHACGMTGVQCFRLVQLPLAAPVILAGIRTSAVWTIGSATLATPVGQTSLGNFIFSGLQTQDWVSVLTGCVAAAVLAMLVDNLLGLIERGIGLRNRLRVIIGLAGLVLGALAAVAASFNGSAGGKPRYVIAAKGFSEQYILAQLLAQRLQASGAEAEIREGLGSAVIFKALVAGEIDIYVDYSGTLWTNVLARRDHLTREQMRLELASQLQSRHGVKLAAQLGFENAYALMMTRPRAAALGVSSIADLARHASLLTLATDLEFLSRPEWRALRDAYGLQFAAERSFAPTFMYRALADGSADVITGFSSDGRVEASNLLVLADPKSAIPSYDAVLLISPQRAADPRLLRLARDLDGKISVEMMRRANFSVDRDDNKASPTQAARDLSVAISAPPAPAAQP